MKCPAKIYYSIKALAELGQHYESNQAVSINSIAEKQGISSKFLLQLMVRLKNAGLVHSLRGISGGYVLSQPASGISLKEIIRAVDASLLGPDPKHVTSECKTDRIIDLLWESMNSTIDAYWANLTLQCIVDRCAESEFSSYQI